MMRAAVSENRRTVSCFVCVGYRWAEQRAAMPRRDRTRTIAMARPWAPRLHRFFKAVASQARSVIAAVAAAVAFLARAASSAATRARSSTGAPRRLLRARGVVSASEYAGRGDGAFGPWSRLRQFRRIRSLGRFPHRQRWLRRRIIRWTSAVEQPPKSRIISPPTSGRHCPPTRRAIKLVARTPTRGSRGGPSTFQGHGLDV